MKRSVCTVLALAMTVMATGIMAADEKKPAMDPAMQQAMMAAMAPGEHHEHMKALVGNWDYTIKAWMDPSQPPMESTGKRSAELIMGGRYLSEKYSGDFMGMPFEGQGLMGYDNMQKKYFSTWVDNMSTGVMVSDGQCAKGPMWTMNGEMPDPMTGKMSKSRTTMKLTDADHFVMEMFAPGADGKEMKMMEISGTRAK